MLLTKNEQAQIRANIDATAIAANPLTCRELLALLDIVARLPHTADGVPVICDGMTVYCLKWHAKKLTHATSHVYCCEGECWDDGCQDPTPLQMATTEELVDELSARCTALVAFGAIARTTNDGQAIIALNGDLFACVGMVDALMAAARAKLAHSLHCNDPDCDTCRGKRESDDE